MEIVYVKSEAADIHQKFVEDDRSPEKNSTLKRKPLFIAVSLSITANIC